MNHVEIWGRAPGRGNSTCKVPEAEASLACDRREATVLEQGQEVEAGETWSRGRHNSSGFSAEQGGSHVRVLGQGV